MSSNPYVERLAERVLDFIRDTPGTYPKAVGERTLAAALDTNRRQIRNALALLQEQGRLKGELRPGTFGYNGTMQWTINDRKAHR